MSKQSEEEMRVLPSARVFQIADVLSITVSEVAEKLKARGVQVRGAKALVSWEDTRALLEASDRIGNKEVCRDLILKAFDLARKSGKEDWQVMTAAVLKNRLLDLTDGGFREAEYGAPTMGHLVRDFPEMLEVESISSGDFRIRIVEAALPVPENGVPAPSRIPAHGRLREDLWTAFFDFSHQRSYVWDLELGQAVAGAAGENKIAIPSLTAEEEAVWRSTFRSEIEQTSDSQELEAVDAWITKRLGTIGLPADLRGQWSRFLRKHIAERAEKFFSDEELPPPPDIVVAKGSLGRGKQRDSDDLRRFVHRCVSLMTEKELAELQISASVLFRAHSPEQL